MRKVPVAIVLTLLALTSCRVQSTSTDAAQAQATEAATDASQWCDTAPAIELTIDEIAELDSATPEELASYFSDAVNDLSEGSRFAPAELREDMGTLVHVSNELEGLLAPVDWDLNQAVAPNEELLPSFRRAWDRVLQYNADFCGIENGAGSLFQASDLDEPAEVEMDPEERAAITAALSDSNLTTDEVECLVDAIERFDEEMSTLLEAAHPCGIELERMIAELTG